MARYQISLRQGDIPADHIERRMAEDLLEAEHIATVDEVAASEGVAKVCGLQRVPTPARRPRRAIACWTPRAVSPVRRRLVNSGSPGRTGPRVAR